MRWILGAIILVGLAFTTQQLPTAGSGPRYAGWGDFEWNDGVRWADENNQGAWDNATWDYFQWA